MAVSVNRRIPILLFAIKAFANPNQGCIGFIKVCIGVAQGLPGASWDLITAYKGVITLLIIGVTIRPFRGIVTWAISPVISSC